MPQIPTVITNVDELEELLSRPTKFAMEAMRKLDGDLMILGVGGKMGPSLARQARRAADEAGRKDLRVIGVSRFSSQAVRDELERHRIETIACDLLDEGQRRKLPAVHNVLMMTAFKFGASDRPDLAWATNTYLPALLAEQFHHSRIVAFSTGNVYPLVSVDGRGADESTPPEPVGEYGVTALGRERLISYVSHRYGTPACLVRLNYAVELRYGVPVDLGQAILAGEPIDLSTSHVNIVWQGYANAVALAAFGLAASPPAILNLTGPDVLRVRELAEALGRRLGVAPKFIGQEQTTALLNDAGRCIALFGRPEVDVERILDLVATWLKMNGQVHGKPTKFQVRDGQF